MRNDDRRHNMRSEIDRRQAARTQCGNGRMAKGTIRIATRFITLINGFSEGRRCPYKDLPRYRRSPPLYGNPCLFRREIRLRFFSWRCPIDPRCLPYKPPAAGRLRSPRRGIRRRRRRLTKGDQNRRRNRDHPWAEQFFLRRGSHDIHAALVIRELLASHDARMFTELAPDFLHDKKRRAADRFERERGEQKRHRSADQETDENLRRLTWMPISLRCGLIDEDLKSEIAASTAVAIASPLVSALVVLPIASIQDRDRLALHSAPPPFRKSVRVIVIGPYGVHRENKARGRQSPNPARQSVRRPSLVPAEHPHGAKIVAPIKIIAHTVDSLPSAIPDKSSVAGPVFELSPFHSPDGHWDGCSSLVKPKRKIASAIPMPLHRKRQSISAGARVTHIQ